MAPIRCRNSTDILRSQSSPEGGAICELNWLKTEEEKLDLDFAQLIERYVAAHEMSGFDLGQCWLGA